MFLFAGIIYLSLLNDYVNSGLHHHKRDFKTIFEWSQLEFDYPSPYERQQDIDRGIFIPGKPTPIDTDIYYTDYGFNKIFITAPKLQAGVPVALGTVSTKFVNQNPVIVPYPSWSWHTEPEKCKPHRIVSVYRVTIDECGRLWVLDTGRIVDNIICPPQVLIFDLETDTLIHRYEIPYSQIDFRSILVTPVVEVLDKSNRCQNSFAYLADCRAFSIIVYDLKRDTSWKVTDKSMYPYPSYGTFTIEGESFELMDGVLGLSLSPKEKPQRKLFYHALSSPSESWVYTSYLRNQSLFSSDTSPTFIFNTFVGKRQTQAAAEAIDCNGIMYFGLVNDSQIACYNTATGDYGSWTSSDIVGDNRETLQFASGVKVLKNKKGEEEIWIVSSKFAKVALGTLNPNEINYRILAANVKELLEGTQCMKADVFVLHDTQLDLI